MLFGMFNNRRQIAAITSSGYLEQSMLQGVGLLVAKGSTCVALLDSGLLTR